MRKLKFISLVFVALLTLGVGGSAFAQSAETGEGKDATDANGDPAPHPEDPTSDLDNQAADPLFVGADDNDGNGVRVAVAIGDENEADSVGRLGVALSADGSGGIYAEDYTEGDQVANTVEDANQATGCVFLPPDEGESCSDESDDDAVLISGSA